LHAGDESIDALCRECCLAQRSRRVRDRFIGAGAVFALLALKRFKPLLDSIQRVANAIESRKGCMYVLD
jgi:hypothetical protein